MKMACILAAAFLLDCLLGDPRWLPHPICLMGKLIAGTEKGLRRLVKNEFFGGLLLVIVVITVSTAVPWVILILAGMINPWLETVLQVWFCYQILAMKSLCTESMRVYTPLKAGDLPLARKYLSWIVGRETDRLDEEGVAKAAVETVAENTSDGVVAPLVFMAIGGAPLGFLYKAINTMDSMIGYKNDKYIRFGRVAARLDDAANLIPARLSALLMILASYILRFDGANARRIYWRDRHNHKSPNSAQTESVCAGALHSGELRHLSRSPVPPADGGAGGSGRGAGGLDRLRRRGGGVAVPFCRCAAAEKGVAAGPGLCRVRTGAGGCRL